LQSHLLFNSHIGQVKRAETIEDNPACPFCSRHLLEEILDEDGCILLVKNKYPVLEDTFQTVLVETDDCLSELSLYPKDHLYRVLRFGIRNWFTMIQSGEYASVLFFKNHGPYSGGTIRHPHMQIVGLKNYDYHNNFSPDQFKGIVVHKTAQVEFNLSAEPRVGFFEFNVVMDGMDGIVPFSDYLQTAAHFVLNHYHSSCTSYNIFFYEWDDKIAAKVMPRFVTSPLYVGYGIPQISNRIQATAEKVKQIYFP
jgi:ATP adenylyltransferase/5',5'''-P-1,P-4-tetraphosphate phosphorylase II